MKIYRSIDREELLCLYRTGKIWPTPFEAEGSDSTAESGLKSFWFGQKATVMPFSDCLVEAEVEEGMAVASVMEFKLCDGQVDDGYHSLWAVPEFTVSAPVVPTRIWVGESYLRYQELELPTDFFDGEVELSENLWDELEEFFEWVDELEEFSNYHEDESYIPWIGHVFFPCQSGKGNVWFRRESQLSELRSLKGLAE
jgi:hypothetical protein